MKQQINLHQPQQKQNRQPVDAISSLSIIAFSVVVLVALGYFNQHQYQQQQQRFQQLQQQRTQLQQTFEDVRLSRNTDSSNPELAATAQILQQKLDAQLERSKLLAQFDQQLDIAWTPLLTQALQAQTKQTRLNSLLLDTETKTLQLEGLSRAPKELSQFLIHAGDLAGLQSATTELQLNRLGQGQRFTAVLALQKEPSQ